MKLIHLYIYSYKHLRKLNIPLHGAFKCECTDDGITLRKSKTFDNYYDGLSIQGIIGKNGIGKSTILELICNNKPDYHQQFIMIWHDNQNGYKVQSNYYELDRVDADDTYSFYTEGVENAVSLVSINNISPPFSYTRGLSSRGSFLTPSTYKSYDANRRQQSRVLSNYFSSSNNYSNDIRPRYFLSLKKLREGDIQRILKVIQKDKKADHLFSDFMSSYGFKAPEYIFSSIRTHSHDLAKSSLYLTISLQLAQTYKHLNKLNSSYQHCAGLILFLTFMKNQIDDYEFSVEEWSNLFYPLFDKVELNPGKTIRNKKISISNYASDNYIRSLMRDIDYYFNENYYSNFIENEESKIIHISQPEKIQSFLTKIEESPYNFKSNIDYGWDGLSSGELAKSMLLANIFWYIQRSEYNRPHIILIDEIDLYLHPEWQRKIVNDIISLVKNEMPTEQFQFIITSHSPIIISDLLPENIVNISRSTNGEISISPPPGYATQISDLYMSGMHITSTFGERVHSTLTNIMEKNGKLSDDDKLILGRIRSKNIRQLLGAE
ncbi:AAA family ATPase [Aeromonas caviae]|uniref:AAA family ATPase n=1 Tax=Aeromonas caviae TaxID=648 RepID=UPI00191D139D|nr:AAA family ATPase [Aeromonas caviae]MBL0487275.1 AAA family ATPase [Aeromonas caviae]